MAETDLRLDGWKEIASFLRRTVRTVQRWEKERHLPVHRIDGGQKGSAVFAFSGELNDWIKMQSCDERPVPGRWGELASASRIPALSLVMFLVSGSLLLTTLLSERSSRNPAFAVAEGSSLRAYSAASEPLWSREFDFFFEHARAGLVRDLDGDGTSEVLTSEKSAVICLDADGRLRWKRSLDRQLRWNDRVFPRRLEIRKLSTGQLGSGESLIIATANSTSDFPSRTVIFDHRGRQLGEYWNTGHVFDHLAIDVDQDGTDEVLLGGANHLYDRPFLALISPHIKRAISPAPEKTGSGLIPGREIYYGLLPATDVGTTSGFRSGVTNVRQTPEGNIVVHVGLRNGSPGSGIQERVYETSPVDWTIRKLKMNNAFLSLHEQFFREGKLDHQFDASEKMAFRRLMSPANGHRVFSREPLEAFDSIGETPPGANEQQLLAKN